MDEHHLTFFVDPAWKRPLRHTPFLFPFWGDPYSAEKMPLAREMFERYSFDTSCYGITDDIAAADMILVPYRHQMIIKDAPDVWDACVALSHHSGKPLLIDGMGDIEDPINIPNAIVLRYGGFRSLPRGRREIQMPVYADDLLEICCGGQLRLRAKSERPSIAFAGWSSMSVYQTARTIAKELPVRLRSVFDDRYRACKKGIFFRRQAMAVLGSSSQVDTNFIARSSFSTHMGTTSGVPKQLQKEMIDNLLGSDYGLDVRGDANASTRLFEILSLGRIPIIVDTERNFPFEDQLDYSSFSLKVDFRDMNKLPQIVADFHAQLSHERFVEMQKNARAAFRNYFRIDAIMPHVVREIRQCLTPALP